MIKFIATGYPKQWSKTFKNVHFQSWFFDVWLVTPSNLQNALIHSKRIQLIREARFLTINQYPKTPPKNFSRDYPISEQWSITCSLLTQSEHHDQIILYPANVVSLCATRVQAYSIAIYCNTCTSLQYWMYETRVQHIE